MANALVIMVMFFFMFAWYSNYSLRNKVLCVYTRVTGQEIRKLVTLKDKQVSFDRKLFNITPERHRVVWHPTFFGLFGTWVICYHFVWYSYLPEDPREYGVVTMSPEVRAAMNQEEKFRAYNRAEDARIKKKGGMFEMLAQVAPIFTIILLVAVIYFLYTQGNQINILQEMQSLPKP